MKTEAADTIAAIATGAGVAGIGIIRISGPDATGIVRQVFKSCRRRRGGLRSHQVRYGHLVEPGTGEVIDEVLVTYMRAPHSYTREDVVEIGCHGGPAVLRTALQVITRAGARLAEPGEFTRRAFLAGRIDLAQAEAVCELIRAQSDRARAMALRQLDGALSGRVRAVAGDLTGLIAAIEATIDFPDDDLEDVDRSLLAARVREQRSVLDELLARADEGKVIRDGLRTVIVGRPNVGKSSLMNALLGQERAIVTPVPGTTRDLIEESVVVRGIRLVLTDTAGLRPTTDVVEGLGVARTQGALAACDLVLAVFDGSQELDEHDRAVAAAVRDYRCIAVINKADLGTPRVDPAQLQALLGETPVVTLSARTGQGVERLTDAVATMFLAGKLAHGELPLVAAARHISCLEHARAALESAHSALEGGTPVDLVAIDLREAAYALGELTGENASDQLIDRIFRDFCVGK
jgi:tRNA modification GTPase